MWKLQAFRGRGEGVRLRQSCTGRGCPYLPVWASERQRLLCSGVRDKGYYAKGFTPLRELLIVVC